MHEAFVAARKRHRSTRARIETGTVPRRASVDWKTVRQRQFQREHQRELGKRYDCKRCGGPVSEAMLACPWCGTGRKTFKDETSFPAACPRCKRGVKLDWAYCPWCYGAAIGPLSEREYRDKRYTARCARRGCERRDLMPFMRYCPWCRSKVRRTWPVGDGKHRCSGCRWGVHDEYWSHCPWCARRRSNRPRSR